MTPRFGGKEIPPEEIQFETTHFLCLSRPQPVLDGSGLIIPRRFVTNPFDLSPAEWADLRLALHRARAFIEKKQSPAGYNIGWNVGSVAGQEVDHLHLHIIPRFADEPLAGQGIRHHLKQPHNSRPL